MYNPDHECNYNLSIYLTTFEEQEEPWIAGVVIDIDCKQYNWNSMYCVNGNWVEILCETYYAVRPDIDWRIAR